MSIKITLHYELRCDRCGGFLEHFTSAESPVNGVSVHGVTVCDFCHREYCYTIAGLEALIHPTGLPLLVRNPSEAASPCRLS